MTLSSFCKLGASRLSRGKVEGTDAWRSMHGSNQSIKISVLAARRRADCQILMRTPPHPVPNGAEIKRLLHGVMPFFHVTWLGGLRDGAIGRGERGDADGRSSEARLRTCAFIGCHSWPNAVGKPGSTRRAGLLCYGCIIPASSGPDLRGGHGVDLRCGQRSHILLRHVDRIRTVRLEQHAGAR